MYDNRRDDGDPTAPRLIIARPGSGPTVARDPASISASRRTGRRGPWVIGLIVVTGLATFVLAGPAFAGPFSARPAGATDSGAHTAAGDSAAPDKPNPPTAVAGDGRATVTITRPTGGSDHSYRVQVTDDISLWCYIDTAHTSCPISDLMNGVSYTFHAYAIVPGEDPSVWSNPSNAVTPRAAGTTSTPTPTATPTPTPTATPTGPGRALLTLPKRIVSSTGDSAAMPVSCAISSGMIARCVVTTTAVVGGQTVAVGYGVTTPTLTQNLQKVTVSAVLTELGRYLAARPSGFRAYVTAEVIQRDVIGSTSADSRTKVVAQRYELGRSIGFNVDSAVIRSTEKNYLTAARGKLADATTITCVGHADSRERARSTLGARRARAACDVIARNLDASVRTSSTIDLHPVGAHNTAAARARNRRVDITITN